MDFSRDSFCFLAGLIVSQFIIIPFLRSKGWYVDKE